MQTEQTAQMALDSLGILDAELQARLHHLDALAHQGQGAPPGPLPRATPADMAATKGHFDVVLLGGGLSLMLAVLLAQRGLRTAVIERHRIGRAHREWNASQQELDVLTEQGLVTRAELQQLIVARYRFGRCMWAGGHQTHIRGVLDCAVDAQGLLTLLRERAIAHGVTLVEDSSVEAVHAYEHGLCVMTTAQDGPGCSYTAAVVLDGRGAGSPYARGDLVCPTVGGVLADLEIGPGPQQIDPGVGDILVTTEGAEEGRQHIWEAFPVGDNKTAVYLFYYTERRKLPPRALTRLYARFFTHLPRFKRGPARLVRPTFGLIPGWSRLSPGPKSPHPRLVLVGDAASRHSPLTFCGFGAALRSLSPAVAHVTQLLASGHNPSSVAVDDQALHQVTGALAMVMARPDAQADADALNQLLDAAFLTLVSLGDAAYGRLLRDEMQPREVLRFMWQTSRRHPQVWSIVRRALSLGELSRWTLGLARRSPRGAARTQGANSIRPA